MKKEYAPKLKVVSNFSIADNMLKIYVDGMLHLSIKRKAIIGLQSWIEGEYRKKFIIEIYTRYKTIIIGYRIFKLWKRVLAELDSIPMYSVTSDEE